MIMSIATEISRLQTAKADIKTAIEAKGVTVPSNATLDTYDDYVSQISGGGGTSYEEELKGLIDRSISAITIPSGVTKIGDGAFYGCTEIKTVGGTGSGADVIIPNTVTSIGARGFQASYVTAATFPDSVTSIGTSIFDTCPYLKSVHLSSGITRIENNAFLRCASLETVDIPSGVTTIGQTAFYQSSAMTSVVIPSGATSLGTQSFGGIGQGSRHCDVTGSIIGNTSASTNVFQTSNLKGSITILKNALSGATSGTSSSCYQMFNGTLVMNDGTSSYNNILTIDVYADGCIIPRYMFGFSNSNSWSNGVRIIIHGSPVFLSQQAFKSTTGATVTFVDCTTPPNAQSYSTGSTSPFYQFTGTVYVPSSAVSAWKSKYTGISSKIEAIPE